MGAGRRGLRIAGAVLVALGLVVLVLGEILPALARKAIERRASAAFPGVVTIGDLGIGWRDGSVHATDVGVWAIDAPAAPLLRMKRLSLRFDLGALRHREVSILEAVVEAPDLHVERFADGRFSVGDLAPGADAAASAEPRGDEAGDGKAWRVRVGAVRLIGGRVRFLDFAVEGSAALPIEIDRIELAHVSLQPGPLPEPATLRAEARIGGAPVRLAVVATSLLPRLAFEATLELAGLRLEHVALVGEAIGLGALAGTLDARLHHVFETGRSSVLDGHVTLQDVAAGATHGEGAAPLGVARLELALASVDLRARRARIDRVAVGGASVLVTPGSDTPLPVLAPWVSAPPDLPPDATAPPLAPWAWTVTTLVLEGAHVRIEAQGAPPLDVTATLRADRVEGAVAKPFPLTLEASAASGKATLQGDAQLGPPAFRGRLRLAGVDLARAIASIGAEGGSLAARVRGGRAAADLSLDFPADDPAKPIAPEWLVRGRVSLSDVSRPPAPTTGSSHIGVGFEQASLLLHELRLASPFAAAERRGDGTVRARAALQVAGAEGVIAPKPGEPGIVARWRSLDLALDELRFPDPVTGPAAGSASARGRVTLAGFALADWDPERESELGVAFERLDARLEELRLAIPPAATPAEPPARSPIGAPAEIPAEAEAERSPLRLEHVLLASASVDAPWLHLTRTKSGLSLPPALLGGPGGGAAAGLAAAPVALANGRVRFVDQTVTPYYDADLSDVRLDARVLGSRGPTLEGGRLEMASGRDGRVRIEGGGDANGLTFVVNATGLALPPLNPYATVLGYELRGGDANLVSSVWIGPTGIEAKSWLTLRQLVVRELTADAFQRQTGVSLSLALDVLTDGDGEIELTLPVWWNAEGFGLRADETLRAATRQAIVGTLVLPLRKLGALVGGEPDQPTIAPPPPIPFAPGSASLSAEAEARVRELAQFLASRPAVEIGLEARAVPADGPDELARRDLAERRLERVRERLRQGYGVLPRQLRALPPAESSTGPAVWIRLDQA